MSDLSYSIYVMLEYRGDVYDGYWNIIGFHVSEEFVKKWTLEKLGFRRYEEAQPYV